ncbi:MAG TPA: sulfatase-like hydrolase/transferase [Polyangiaceae bacterium]|nr:sulfatase-like hydrolase/transferase [Polyangiaceae bacterium]
MGLRGGPRFRVREGAKRPDIVLFLTDEQRHDQVGYSSGGHFETPHLDALAARGTIFERAYSGSTVCVPSRASLLTGLSYPRLPLQHASLALREGSWTLPRVLRSVGYRTALVGKMHFSPMYADHGFDVMKLAEHLVPFSGYGHPEIDDYHKFLMWQGRADARATHMYGPGLDALGEEYNQNHSAVPFPYDASLHPVGWVASTAKDVIAKRDGDAPLFLVVSFPRPHTPLDPAEPYASMYDPKDARVPDESFEPNLSLPGAFRAAFESAKRDRHPLQRWDAISDPVKRRILTAVRGLTRQIDDAVGDVLSALDPSRSVVFFTSDHGSYDGHRGLLGKVPWLPFEDLARVPFVCAAPGGATGQRVRAPVQSWDFALTCMDYAGVDPPPGVFDSESLRPILEGGAPDEGRPVFTGGIVCQPMLVRGPHKLIRNGQGEEVLFDLATDPGETRDVLEDAKYGSVVSELRAELSRVLARETVDLPVR